MSWGTQGWRPGCKRFVAAGRLSQRRLLAARAAAQRERHFRLRGVSRRPTRTRTLSTRRGQWQALRRLWIRPRALMRPAQWLLRCRLPDPRELQAQQQLLESQLEREAGRGTRWPGSAGTARPRILRRTDL